MTTIDRCMQEVLDTYAVYYEEGWFDQFIGDLTLWLDDRGYTLINKE